MAATYTLNVMLDAAELQDMKESGYSLCIAKKVNNKYNVVWQGTSSVLVKHILFIPLNHISRFLENTRFQWTEQYGVFGQAGFTSGALVDTSTNTVPIQFGMLAHPYFTIFPSR